MIPSLNINRNWTLFLDRDGVINERIIDGYVMDTQDFVLKKNVLEAIQIFRPLFGRIVVVTNQQCVAKGLCSLETIQQVQAYMESIFAQAGSPIDGVFFCPHRTTDNCNCRKPKIGLAQQAKEKFPEIDFQSSIMIGDMPSDLQMGRNCGMKTVFVGEITDENRSEIEKNADFIFQNLYDFATHLK